jgi:selenocysteine lyase/cysteine desulfurase
MSRSYRALFSASIRSTPGLLHFAAHSHHRWPDAALKAQTQYAFDSAALLDNKWGKIFGKVIPEAQGHIARVLRTETPANIAFETNTHNLFKRLLSCFPAGQAVKILSTDSEFHSFSRQTKRLAEEGLIEVKSVPTEPFETFPQRLVAAAADEKFDLVFFSHVFFNSGYAVPDLPGLVRSIDAVVDAGTFIAVDGYHGFMALPTDLSSIENRAFYIAGGYKYAMAGENVCFMHCPPGYGPRPRDTGWFAGFAHLTGAPDKVQYGVDGSRFLGATFDPSGLYRFNAVQRMLQRQDLGVQDIHLHVASLQAYFLKNLAGQTLRGAELVPGPFIGSRGHFLTFRTPGAAEIYQILSSANIMTDYRGDNLRFGFGIYHRQQEINALLRRMDDSGLLVSAGSSPVAAPVP